LCSPSSCSDSLDILHISLTNKPNTSLSVVCSVSLLDLTQLQRTTLHDTTSNRSLQLISAALNRKVGERNLIRVSVDDRRHAEIVGSDFIVVDVQFKVSSVIDVLPLEFFVRVNQPVGSIISGCEGNVLAIGTWGRNRRASELNTDAVVTRSGIVAFVIQPDEIRHPRGVRVSRHDDIIANAIVVEMRQSAVAVSLIAIPSIVVKRVGIAIRSTLINPRKHSLRANQSPRSTTVSRLSQLVVEPVFLSAAHHTSTSIIADIVDVIGVPVEISNGTIVLTCIQHDQIEKTADAETSPDAKVIVHFDLTDGHPFEICSDGIHLSLIHGNTSVADEGGFGVVELGSAVAVCVVGNLVVIPNRDPWVVLVRSQKVEIGTVGSEAFAVVVEGGDDTFGFGNAVDAVAIAVVTIACVFVDVVAEVDYVVDRVFANGVSVGVEEAECWVCVS
jgi:hypothetical protein